MRKFITTAVRYLTRWAWQKEISIVAGMAHIEEIHAQGGNRLELSIKQNPALAQYVAQCFAELVASSENYTEMRFDLKHPTAYDGIYVLVKKFNGKTPHELRMIAEKELADLKASK